MKTLVLGIAASVALSAAVLVAPASAAPVPTTAGGLSAQTDTGVTQVRMMSSNKMMMRKKMMMRHKMMMRKKMMMKKRMM